MTPSLNHGRSQQERRTMILQDILRSGVLVLLLSTGVALAQDSARNDATPAAAVPAETTGQAAPAAAEYAPQKAVYHINYPGGIDGSGYKPALNNLDNHLTAVGGANLDLRVVMHGDGLGLLAAANKDQALQGIISDLKVRGVRFLVCNNTLVGRNIDPETDLFDVWPEDIVQAGVAEVARLQQEGFVYIKP